MSLKRIIFNLKNILFRQASWMSYIHSISYQNLSVEKRKNQSFKQRIDLIKYAYDNCPFYKDFYDHNGFHPSQLKSEEDWGTVPVLEKDMIRKNGKRMFSVIADMRRMNPSSTGGSTGTPLVVYKSADVHYEILGWRALSWYGLGPWENEAIAHRRVPTSLINKLKNRILWWPTKRAYLDATNISEAKIHDFIRDIKRMNTKWVVGYCGSLEYVADYILRNSIDIDSVQLVWSTSSPLTEIVREKIQSAFKCKVMDQYGCCEMGNIAIQKPNEDCLTVNSDYVHVDIINGVAIVPEGEYGDVCITDLHCKEFPLIKYRLGDRASLLHTMNDSYDGFPKLSFVKGRTTDMLPLPNGDVLDGSYLTTICDAYSDYISCYQLYQRINYDIVFYVVLKKDDKLSGDIVTKIKEQLCVVSNNQINIHIKKVDSIPDFAGKRKFIISELTVGKSSMTL